MRFSADLLKPYKVLSGFFYPQDLRFSDLKGAFFNEVKKICKISSNLHSLQVGPLNVLKISENPNFEIKMTDTFFNYENIFTDMDDFIDTSMNMAESWKIISGCVFTRVGGVINLIVPLVDSMPIEFIKKYINDGVPFGKGLSQGNTVLNFNFPDEISGKLLNINLTLKPTDQLLVTLDINQTSESGFDLEESRNLLRRLFSYKDEQLLSFLNYGEK